MLGIAECRTLQSGVAQLLIHSVEIQRSGAVELLGSTLVKHRSLEFEDLGQFLEQVLRKLVGFVDQENRAAEGVQPLHILLARNGIHRTSFDLCREPARKEGGCQETAQCDPILRIRDGEFSDWRQEEEIKRESR